MTIQQWIIDNHLDVEWLEETVFKLNDKIYQCIHHKDGYIFEENFCLLFDENDLFIHNSYASRDLHVNYFVFLFGGVVYYTDAGSDKIQLNQLRYIGKARELSGFDFLGVHGPMEMGSGSALYSAWMQKAKWMGVETMAICEKHTLAGVIKFQESCKKAGIRSIVGETIIVKDGDEKYQVKLYVADYQGWRNLLRIHKDLNINNDGHYVQLDVLIKCASGLFLVFCSETKLNLDMVSSFTNLYDFKGVFFQYDPVQYKNERRDLHVMECLKTYLKGYRDRLGMALICDAYYLDQQDHRVRKLLSFVGSGEFMHDSDNQHFKSLEEVLGQSLGLFETAGEEFAMGVLEEALIGADKIVSGCDFKVPLGEVNLPMYEMTDQEKSLYKTNVDLFWGLVGDGLERKVIERGLDAEPYYTRLEEEMAVILGAGLESYFLILYDLSRWCRENNVLTGIGRGSAAGSLISYCLSITEADPLEYGLLFSRFVNSGRLPKLVIQPNGERKLVGGSMADIDFDVSAARREDVKRYLEERWGENNVCTIGSYNTLQLKGAFRDALRFHGETPQNVNFFAEFLTESGDNLVGLFYEALAADKLKQFVNEHVEAVNDIELLLEMPKSASKHPAGLIITPRTKDGEPMEIYDWMPCKKMTFKDKESGEEKVLVVSEWDGVELDSAGFLKEDILGLDQLDKIAAIIDLIEKHHNKHIDWIAIDKNDPKVFELFQKGFNQDVFQFGTPGLSAYCKEVQPDSILELADINALYRPGPMDVGAHTDYVKIKHGRKDPEYDWGTEEILKSTYSLMTYQEQIMKICQKLAGFSLEDADGIRKAIGKKLMDKMLSYRDRFINGAVDNGCPHGDAVRIWNKIEGFAAYSFNLSHAVCYAITGYNCNWFKAHYPLEFWTIALQEAKDDDVPLRISELNKFGGINIMPPDVNKSVDRFVTDWDTNSIYWSLGRISHVASVAIGKITSERSVNGQFFSLEEFVKRVKGREVNSRVVKHLILSGCFDQIHNIDFLPKRLELIKQFAKLYKLDLSEEFPDSKVYNEFFWYRLQRDLSKYGYFNYEQMMADLGYSYNEYITPDQIQLSDNEGWEGNSCGIIKEAIKRRTKKGEMCRLILDNNNDQIDVILWHDQWMPVKDLIESNVGGGVIVKGQVKYDAYNKKNALYSYNETEVKLI